MTHRDGSVTRLLPGARISGAQAIHLTNGQNVEFDKLAAIEIDPSEDNTITLLFVNGKRLPGKSDLSTQSLVGKNELGEFVKACRTCAD